MELHDYLRVLRTRWRLITLCALVGIGAAAALSLVQTPKYEASTQLFVAAKSTDVTGAYQGDLFTQQRVKSYADIVDSPPVTEQVIEQLNLNVTNEQLAREISASARPDTVLLDIHVTDTQPLRAQAIANSVSAEFAQLASKLEALEGTTSPVKVTVVKAADLPSSPVTPKTTRNVVLGCFLGLLAGLGLAVLRETLDTSVKHLDELVAEVDVAPLGVVLYDPEAVKRPLIVHAAAQSSRSEAFRQLRTNLQFVDVDAAPRSIVVTSSVPEEGKSTTTANLALSLAQAGVRVCLVEGDLRRPRLAQYLGLEDAAGLTNVLIGRATLDEVLQPWGDAGQLTVLSSGPTPPNPSELLGARSMAAVIGDLEARFDLVLIDAPPLLPVTDAAVLANLCSGALLVIRHGKTKKEQVRRAVDALRSVDANIYGVVLNMAPHKGPDAYYYGYAYRYDYKPSRPVEIQPASVRRTEPAPGAGTTTVLPTSTKPASPSAHDLREPGGPNGSPLDEGLSTGAPYWAPNRPESESTG